MNLTTNPSFNAEVMDDGECACNSLVFLHDVTSTPSSLPNITIGCKFLFTENVKCKFPCVLVTKECMEIGGVAPLILVLFAAWK